MLKLIIVVCCVQVVFSEKCQTYWKKKGRCIDIKECDELLKLVPKATSTSNARLILKKSYCGNGNSGPKVCCPEIAAASSDAPDLSKGATDYIPALPIPPICGISNGSFSRIVNGANAELGDFPWMAALGYTTTCSLSNRGPTDWMCSGSLISARHVLTAAHCMYNYEYTL